MINGNFKKLTLIVTLSFFTMISINLSTNAQENKKSVKVVKRHIANIETTKGKFKFVLYDDKTPVTVKNFIALAKKGFYNGLTFHRYEPNFVIQGGDPKGDGTGGSDKTIPLEIDKSLSHIQGAVGMARSQDPNSASSQFYVTLEPSSHLDSGYCVFGQVTDGMDTVKKLRVGDKMIKVTITDSIKNRKVYITFLI